MQIGMASRDIETGRKRDYILRPAQALTDQVTIASRPLIVCQLVCAALHCTVLGLEKFRVETLGAKAHMHKEES